MWTWQFELNDILTTLIIVGMVAGFLYKWVLYPVILRHEDARMQDNLLFNERMNTLNETLVELKNEIKLSREQRIKFYTEHIKLSARVDNIESHVDELKEAFHEHTTEAH